MVRTELITCHDCGNGVSFTAAACPRCGSREPTGPYRHSRKEARKLGAEGRNDRNLIVATLGLASCGILYGVITSSSTVGALIAGFVYGIFGMLIGPPVAFTINIMRDRR